MGRRKNVDKIREIIEQDHILVDYVSEFDNGSAEYTSGPTTCYRHKRTNKFLCFGTDESIKDYKFILDHKIDSHLTHTGGFSTINQKWYGWSHRAIFGFGIGSIVTRDSCSYEPKSEIEMFEKSKDFWEEETKDFRSTVYEVKYNVPNPDGYYETFGFDSGPLSDVPKPKNLSNFEGEVDSDDSDEILDGGGMSEDTEEDITPDETPMNYVPADQSILGMLVCTKTEFFGKQAGRKGFTSNHWQMYPEKWGRGEWTAETLDDAKEMAEAFARSVS